MFIVIDGVDGAGKSSQISLLVQWLADRGHRVRQCHDPGSTPLGDEIRKLLLGGHELDIGARSETLLFMTARAQLVSQVIRPALADGQVVVCDRFALSTLVYQGLADEVAEEDICELNAFATAGLAPDLTLILDLPTDVAVGRLGRARDRMESRGVDYLDRVRTRFLQLANKAGGAVRVVDASRPIEEIHAAICQMVNDVSADLERNRSTP